MDRHLLQFLETPPLDGAVEHRVTTDILSLRAEMREREAALRRDIQALHAALHEELTEQRTELLKWGLLYWIGQAGATGVIVVGALVFLFG